MKAVQVLGDASSPSITTTTSLPKPSPSKDQILAQVHAAGITGDEVTWPEVYKTQSRIPGHDISGTIDCFGPDYKGSLKVGQEVFAFLHADTGEGQAEFVICTDEEVVPKPKSISHSEAAALPIPLLTAWEALAEHGRIEKGAKILVTGASGAVGLCFVQLAVKLYDAHVVALASARNHSKLKDLGAKETVDYNDPDWEKSFHNVDMVFDAAGGEVLTKSWQTVNEKGVIVTVADPPPPWAFGRFVADEAKSHPLVRYLHFIVKPSKFRLAEAAGMIDDGTVKKLAIRGFGFEDAVEAWGVARERGRGEKIVIEFIKEGSM